MERIFYDMMPDYTVSVYLEGEWDFFKSWSNLCIYCDREYDDYELGDGKKITFLNWRG
ncbi:hypothetical protein OPW33_17535 [Vibrio europaeus]|uniref:hypothetical protein n=1 Tax=Vibrio europaeus TaxID=300876 RepID=UPI002341E324|nr:hypothetical protein [Vibrio europaeus]MDC5841128.1 hypothetical protein [Vibrio europaeus]